MAAGSRGDARDLPSADEDRLLRAVVDSLTVGVVVIGPDGCIRAVNPAANALLGLSAVEGDPMPQEFYARLVETDGAPPAADVGAGQVAHMLEGDAGHHEALHRYQHPMLGLRWIQAALRRIEVAAQPFVVTTLVDVTERHDTQERLRGSLAVRQQLVAELDAANERLARNNGQLERFAGAVAHDLRSPLGNLLGFAELLPAVTADLTADAAMIVERIEVNARRAVAMVADLLDYARSAGDSGTREQVDLADIFDWVLETLRPRIAEVEATVAPPARGTVLEVNEAAVRQVFLNLLENSLKYLRSGRRPRVSVGVRDAEPGWVDVEVVDNGRGIPEQHRLDVFKLGGRYVDASDRVPGSGIGLASCRAVVDDHGGRIWIGDEPEGGGTRIVVRLPVAAAAGAQWRSGTVLVVDDDPDVGTMVRLLAERLGLRVVATAYDGAQAEQLLESLEAPPDLVVLDQKLPDCEGVELAARILLRRPEQLIVLQTAHIDEDVRRRALSIGVRLCVSKGSPSGIADALSAIFSGPPA